MSRMYSLLLVGLLLPLASSASAFGRAKSTDIVVTYSGGIARFGYDGSDDKLVRRYETSLPSGTALGAVSNGVVFDVAGDSLYRLDEKGEVSARTYLPGVTAITSYQDRLLASSQQRLVYLNSDLGVLGGVDLYVDSTQKTDASDIIVYDGVAYVLCAQRKSRGVFALRCAVPKSGNPTIIQNDRFRNSHFEWVVPFYGTAHWLDRRLGWYVVSRAREWGDLVTAWARELAVSAMSGVTPHVTLPAKAIVVSESEDAQLRRIGNFVDATPLDPAWVIAKTGTGRLLYGMDSGRFCVGRVSLDGGVFRLLDTAGLVLQRAGGVAPLSPGNPVPVRLAFADDRLYLLWSYSQGETDDSLPRWFATGREPPASYWAALQVYDTKKGAPRLVAQSPLVAHGPSRLYLVER